MKIVAPISSPAELEMLVHCGADELYCGVQPPEWERHYGSRLWLNRRSPDGANFSSLDELNETVARAHEHRIPVYLTLNAPFYPDASLDYLIRFCYRLANEAAIDGFIVADLNLLCRLAGEGLPTRIHLSSLGGCFNHRSAQFYRSLGVDRIILPRQLLLNELERLLRTVGSDVEFEVFALNDGCYFEEGFCQTTHAMGPFCLERADFRVETTGGGERSQAASIPAEDLDELKDYLWFLNNCGSSTQATGLPNGPCSLCRLADFRDWGVSALKIVGREASFIRKMSSLQLLKAVRDMVREGASAEEVARYARSLRDTRDYCERGMMCYYRDI